MWRSCGVAAVVALLTIGCGPATTPCGTFTFSGTPHENHGITNSVSFAFDPSLCKAPACTCNTICYIQIIRIINLDTGEYMQPFSEQADRMVTGDSDATQNGWAV